MVEKISAARSSISENSRATLTAVLESALLGPTTIIKEARIGTAEVMVARGVDRYTENCAHLVFALAILIPTRDILDENTRPSLVVGSNSILLSKEADLKDLQRTLRNAYDYVKT
jgi:hypothetical protein